MNPEIFRGRLDQQVTHLGVGPMSFNCVEAAIRLANFHRIPIMLIASRRQIECARMGGGYVEGWSTEAFAEFVRKRDVGGYVVLARDHGGPWQHPAENKLSLDKAMESAKASYSVDISSGFDLIHIDPSVDPSGAPRFDQVVDRVFELYTHCWEFACSKKQPIAFEIGTEEQGAGSGTLEEMERILQAVTFGCKKNKLPQPLFVVGQTGTKVLERENVGIFEKLAVSSSSTEIRKLANLCAKYGVLLKEHNTDYLSDRALALHPGLGIHAANVAPEFGVVETLAFIRIAEGAGREDLVEKFLALAHSSEKWRKWMKPGSLSSDREKAIICGHYVFASSEFRNLKLELNSTLSIRNGGPKVDDLLQEAVSSAIERYLFAFGLVARGKKAAV